MVKKKHNSRTMYVLDDKECEEMFKTENEARDNTYPSSKYGFSVSVMTTKGNIYPGVSYISDTDTLTMHSEATALVHAAIHGEKNIVAITGPNCHICKQLIWENSLRSGIEIVIIVEESGKIRQIPISELMPYPWPSRTFQKRLDKIKSRKFRNEK